MGVLALLVVAGCGQKVVDTSDVTNDVGSDQLAHAVDTQAADVHDDITQDIDQDLVDDEHVEVGSLI